MACPNCATPLPPGALFCGECGRAVTPPARREPSVGEPAGVDTGSRGTSSASRPEPLVPVQQAAAPNLEERIAALSEIVLDPDPSPAVSALPPSRLDEPVAPVPVRAVAAEPSLAELAESALVATPAGEPCAQCGSPLAPTDIFCGECGFVRGSAVLPEARSAASAVTSSATGLADPVGVAEIAPPGHVASAPHAAPARPVPSLSGRLDDEVAPRPRDTAALDPFPWGLPPAQPAAAAAPTGVSVDLLEQGAFGGGDDDDDDLDDQDTRLIVPSAPGTGGQRFVLQFSTGESVSVFGTGLLGRNPRAEPGEYFDSLVPITDPGRSVSKTHLEFGQDEGIFWVSDRFSGNGTVIREPEREPRRAEAGKRYRVVRGTRVDIGEQFFIVS